jgi:hypothetical protein
MLVQIAAGSYRRKELPENCKFYLPSEAREGPRSGSFRHNARSKWGSLEVTKVRGLAACFRQAGQVGLHLSISSKGRQCAFENQGHILAHLGR